MYTAGQLAKFAGVNIQTIRFYDRQGLLKPISRTHAGYRLYDDDSVKRLHSILQAKTLGFSLKEIRELLSLQIPSVQTCDRVRIRFYDKLKAIRDNILQLKQRERSLKQLIDDCENRAVPHKCPILDKMEG